MKKILISVVIVFALISCKGNGKDGYDISEIYQSKNPEILAERAFILNLLRHSLFEVETAGSHLRSGVLDNCVNLERSVREEYEGINTGTIYTRGRITLDGLRYADTNREIRRGDIVYLCYNDEKKRFYFSKVDLNKPFDAQTCYCH